MGSEKNILSEQSLHSDGKKLRRSYRALQLFAAGALTH